MVHRRLLRITWSELVSNEEVLGESETKTHFSWNQNKTVEISRTHNEKRMLRKMTNILKAIEIEENGE